MNYIGRFAPSPTGPLHFGSLVAALASYLDAKAHNGKWLLRIEDLDHPRCQLGTNQQILNTLKHHHLYWDDEVLYQSQRTSQYQQQVDTLLANNTAYYCECTRKLIRNNGGVHDSACRNRHSKTGAIRFKNDQPIESFTDRFKGKVSIKDLHALEDFVVLRRDSIYAYNLAVVLDDIHQCVTHVVRGDDLLETTSAQLSLYRAFSVVPPTYLHIPVITNEAGQKLSKQNHAPAIDDSQAKGNLLAACKALNLQFESQSSNWSKDELLDQAVQQWHKKHAILPE